MDGPDPSQSSSDKGHDLDGAKRSFDSVQRTPTLRAQITVRRRKRGTRHVAEDLLFVVTFSQSDAGNLPVLECLLGVHSSIISLIEKLKNFFDDKQRRLCFFSASVDQMVSPMFSGGQDLHNTSS